MTETADLLSIVLSLRPAAAPDPSRPLPTWWGRGAQAALLKLIAARDPALAEQMHAPNALRPFTASTLMGRFPAHGLDLNGTYTLRLTSLTAGLTSLLDEALKPGGALAPGSVLELDYLPFTILAAAGDSSTHPWAGRQTYADLSSARLLNERPERRIVFFFASPTVFHSGGKGQPLPLPELVFGSLIERWNAFAPLAFPPEARRYAAECLALSRFELKSRTAAMKDESLRIGAVGRAVYTAVHFDRYWMNCLHTLAEFALYAGVGAGTGMGLGQCRLIGADERI